MKLTTSMMSFAILREEPIALSEGPNLFEIGRKIKSYRDLKQCVLIFHSEILKKFLRSSDFDNFLEILHRF